MTPLKTNILIADDPSFGYSWLDVLSVIGIVVPLAVVARLFQRWQRASRPLRRTVTIEDIGGSALYLLSPLSNGVTGEIHYVDSGYNIISMPRPEVLKAQDAAGVTGEDA